MKFVRLNLEILEGRAVPSPAPLSLRDWNSRPVHQPAAHHHALAGSGVGTYICTLEFGATPSGFHFTGTATLAKLGRVDVQADVYGVGFRDGATAEGQITFSNRHGSVTIELMGPVQSRLSPVPSAFRYKTVNASGEFRHLKDDGALHLTRTHDAAPIRDGVRFFETGSFHLTIS